MKRLAGFSTQPPLWLNFSLLLLIRKICFLADPAPQKMASFPGSGAAPATATTGMKKYFNKSCGKWCTQCPFFRLSGGGGGGHSHAGRPGLPVGAVVMAQIKIDKADRTEQQLMIAGAAFAYFCTPGCGITKKRKKKNSKGKG